MLKQSVIIIIIFSLSNFVIASSGLTSIDTGAYTISKVRTALKHGTSFIAASSYNGTILAVGYHEKISSIITVKAKDMLMGDMMKMLDYRGLLLNRSLTVNVILTGLIWFSTTSLFSQSNTPALNNGRATLSLSGSRWQMEGIRPGQGIKEGFHEHFGEVCPNTFNWNGACVPGDVYTDLWRAGEIDDPHYGRNGMKAKWVMEKEWWYRCQFNP